MAVWAAFGRAYVSSTVLFFEIVLGALQCMRFVRLSAWNGFTDGNNSPNI